MKEQKAEAFYYAALGHVSLTHPADLEWARSVTPDTFDRIGPQDFLKHYCWVVYASGFRVSVIEKIFPRLRSAFQDFDIERLSEMNSLEPVIAVFGNKRKAASFLQGAKLIHKQGFANFKASLKLDGITALERLPGIGSITSKHLAKNVGLADVPKGDVWLQRLAGLFSASNVDSLVAHLARESGETQHTVDYVLWQFCADSGWEAHGCTDLADYVEGL